MRLSFDYSFKLQTPKIKVSSIFLSVVRIVHSKIFRRLLKDQPYAVNFCLGEVLSGNGILHHSTDSPSTAGTAYNTTNADF